MDQMREQFLNQYRLAAQLIIDKKKYQEKLVDEYSIIDKKLQHLGLESITKYLERINSETISEEDKEKQILSVGNKLFGGLKNTERIFLLELYLHGKGILRKNALEGTISKFHETILKLINVIMQSSLWIKKEIERHPQATILQLLSKIFPQIDNYRELLKLEDYHLAKANLEIFLLTTQKEEKISEDIDAYIISIIQRYNNKISGFKQSLMSKFSPGIGRDINYVLKTGFVTLLLVCVMHTNTVAAYEGGLKNESTKSEIITSFSPIFPTSNDYRITALFGSRIISKGSKNHKGIDIGCPSGTEVYAIENGTIDIRRDNGYGLYVTITHSNGVKSLYAHGSKLPANIKTGVVVSKGDVIMYSGNSGASKGPHLHFEISENGNKIDPLPFFSSDILSSVKIKSETISWAQKEAYKRYLDLRGE
jgi:murein DD-endopeptidase MepM/ murein hydrolase activator NlpD